MMMITRPQVNLYNTEEGFERFAAAGRVHYLVWPMMDQDRADAGRFHSQHLHIVQILFLF